MSETLNLTEDQRELLLSGLRYVRSSVLLEFRDVPSNDDDRQREQKLRQIASLVDQLNGAHPAGTTAGV